MLLSRWLAGTYMPVMTADHANRSRNQQAECPRCGKPLSLCVCDGWRHRQQDRAADPPASAGAGQAARHRATDRAALQECDAEDRAVVGEPCQGARTSRRSAALGDPLSRLGRAAASHPKRRSSPSIARARRKSASTRYCAASKASCCSTAPGARRRRCGGAIRGR